mgnify:FL=1
MLFRSSLLPPARLSPSAVRKAPDVYRPTRRAPTLASFSRSTRRTTLAAEGRLWRTSLRCRRGCDVIRRSGTSSCGRSSKRRSRTSRDSRSFAASISQRRRCRTTRAAARRTRSCLHPSEGLFSATSCVPHSRFAFAPSLTLFSLSQEAIREFHQQILLPDLIAATGSGESAAAIAHAVARIFIQHSAVFK